MTNRDEKKINPKTKWDKQFLIGAVDGENIYLRSPSWDCNWYWGFGYLGNKNCHYHLNGLMRDKNLYDGLKEHFGDSLEIPEHLLWEFCELVSTAYKLKETAEVLGRGGSHYTNNPCQKVIMNIEESNRINGVVLPAIFDELNNLLFIKCKEKIKFEVSLKKVISHKIQVEALTKAEAEAEAKKLIKKSDAYISGEELDIQYTTRLIGDEKK